MFCQKRFESTGASRKFFGHVLYCGGRKLREQARRGARRRQLSRLHARARGADARRAWRKRPRRLFGGHINKFYYVGIDTETPPEWSGRAFSSDYDLIFGKACSFAIPAWTSGLRRLMRYGKFWVRC